MTQYNNVEAYFVSVFESIIKNEDLQTYIKVDLYDEYIMFIIN
jgi:hypothetical protein